MAAPEERDDVEPSLQELYEDAPCGYLSLRLDGTVAKVNRTFLRSTGYTAEALLGRRLEELLAPSSRLYYATHWRPKLDLSGEVREVPADLMCADGSRLAVLINAAVARSAAGQPTAIRASLFDATDRRRYERALVAARDEERAARERAERLQRISAAFAGAVSPAEVAASILDELVEFLGAAHGELRVDDIPIGALNADTASAPAGDEAGGGSAAGALTLGLHVGEQEVGELRFVRAGSQPATTAEEERFLQTCAAQCAQALVRAQLLLESRERSAQQAAISSLGAMALEDVALPRLLLEAASALGTTLQAAGVTIAQRDGPDIVFGAHDTPEGRDTNLRVVIGSGPAACGEIIVQRPDPRRFTALEAEFISGVAQVLWHSVERRRHDEAITFQATHDPLTSLPNRRLLSGRLEHEIARARRNRTYFAICLLDLDDFKVVNDTLGHHVGDEILREVGDRLLSAMRDTDMVARFGGDEFVILAADLTGEQESALVVQRVSQALAEPFEHSGGEHVVGASVGVVLGGPASTPESVLDDADIAMYHAKDSGRGLHAVFDHSMREQLGDRLKVESELRIALRDGDLRTFYQPVINARTGRLAGMEALVRWQHPDRGLISPAQFIPVAEASGLIVDLGRHVLTEACRQFVRWRNDGLIDNDVSIAVNVSGRQLTRLGFAAEVAAVLIETGMDKTPALLGLEVTESVLMRSTDSPAAVLEGLAELGVGILLDDFGTGASSLARLKRFPVDTLKIDRSFVREIHDEGNRDDEAIVSAIVAMATALDLRVVAEGVETAAQLASLLKLGCDTIQGFLFSRPLPVDDMHRLLIHGFDHSPVARSRSMSAAV